MSSILFHHSNVQSPIELEQWLSWIIITPCLHGIHHSMVREETDSNWSSRLTVWEWLHGNAKAQCAAAGDHDWRARLPEARRQKLLQNYRYAFRSQPPIWQLPGDGEPKREALALPGHPLAE